MPEYIEKFIFGKIRFWRCPKIKGFRDSVFWRFAKNDGFGILPKTRLHFWHSVLLLIPDEKKGGIYEKEELQRRKMYKEVSG